MLRAFTTTAWAFHRGADKIVDSWRCAPVSSWPAPRRGPGGCRRRRGDVRGHRRGRPCR
ncbi:hypothetical protein [Streptomyces sirii]|uniref:hypothetical protein n=1 Tax=Streptomyces sirii TaxID=3127701 RepID=UPI003D36B523